VIIRREHSTEKKRQIVEETFLPGASVSVVARKYDVNANQVFKWRQLYKRGKLGRPADTPPAPFIPVGVIGKDGSLTTKQAEAAPVPIASPVPPMDGIIEIVLRPGMRVRIRGMTRITAKIYHKPVGSLYKPVHIVITEAKSHLIHA